MSIASRRRALMGAQGGGNSRLPKGFQEVEWIGANVGPAINTGIHAKLETVIKCKMQRTAYEGGGSYPAIFGCASPNYTITYQSSGNNNYVSIGDKTDVSLSYDLRGSFREIELSKASIKINGTVQKNIGATALTENSNRKIAIFARYNASNALERKSNTKCAYFQIYDGETLECDLVPCYRKSDGVIGMYDLVSDNFLTNVGTGTFTKGADVN